MIFLNFRRKSMTKLGDVVELRAIAGKILFYLQKLKNSAICCCTVPKILSESRQNGRACHCFCLVSVPPTVPA